MTHTVLPFLSTSVDSCPHTHLPPSAYLWCWESVLSVDANPQGFQHQYPQFHSLLVANRAIVATTARVGRFLREDGCVGYPELQDLFPDLQNEYQTAHHAPWVSMLFSRISFWWGGDWQQRLLIFRELPCVREGGQTLWIVAGLVCSWLPSPFGLSRMLLEIMEGWYNLLCLLDCPFGSPEGWFLWLTILLL